MSLNNISKVVSTIAPFKQHKLTLIIGTVRTPRVFWKDHRHEFPRLARDVLSIPATGAGVERLFNSARDVCHYRRCSLKPKTIQDIMMFMCTTRFEIVEGRRVLINEYFSYEEIHANDLEPISDNEEGEDNEGDAVQRTVQSLSERAIGKRRKSITSEPEDEEQDNDDGGHLPLPDARYRCHGEFGSAQSFLMVVKLVAHRYIE